MARLSESSKCLNGERLGGPNFGSIAFSRSVSGEDAYELFSNISANIMEHIHMCPIVLYSILIGLELQHGDRMTWPRSGR